MIMTHKYFQENVKYAVKKKNIINAIKKMNLMTMSPINLMKKIAKKLQ